MRDRDEYWTFREIMKRCEVWYAPRVEPKPYVTKTKVIPPRKEKP